MSLSQCVFVAIDVVFFEIDPILEIYPPKQSISFCEQPIYLLCHPGKLSSTCSYNCLLFGDRFLNLTHGKYTLLLQLSKAHRIHCHVMLFFPTIDFAHTTIHCALRPLSLGIAVLDNPSEPPEHSQINLDSTGCRHPPASPRSEATINFLRFHQDTQCLLQPRPGS